MIFGMNTYKSCVKLVDSPNNFRFQVPRVRTMRVFSCILLFTLTQWIAGCVSVKFIVGQTVEEKSGIFFAGALSGLEYLRSGERYLIDENGRFIYENSQPIQFFVGDIALGGQVNGDAVITPLDLVRSKGEYEQEHVVNLMTFLLTIDADNEWQNGIQISPYTRTSALGADLNFSLDAEQFQTDANHQTLIRRLTAQLADGPRDWANREQAQSFLLKQIEQQQRGLYRLLFNEFATGNCRSDRHCEALPLSYQACGPGGYVTLSNVDDNYRQQKQRIEIYYALDKNRYRLATKEPKCVQISIPQPVCIDSRCVDLTGAL